MKPTYTLCFLIRNNSILMLHRNKQPNKGLWNGVGGKIESGETPTESCIREVEEETSYQLDTAHFAGLLKWTGHESGDGALYLFTATVPDGDHSNCDEGTLKWQPTEWVFSSPEVVSNIHHFGPHIIDATEPKLYHVTYRGESIINHSIESLPEEFDLGVTH